MQDTIIKASAPATIEETSIPAKSAQEVFLDEAAEVLMRAWVSSKDRQHYPLTHRLLERICRTIRKLPGAGALPELQYHSLLCHNALWRRMCAHPASQRVSKHPDGYEFDRTKLPLVSVIQKTHRALYVTAKTAMLNPS